MKYAHESPGSGILSSFTHGPLCCPRHGVIHQTTRRPFNALPDGSQFYPHAVQPCSLPRRNKCSPDVLVLYQPDPVRYAGFLAKTKRGRPESGAPITMSALRMCCASIFPASIREVRTETPSITESGRAKYMYSKTQSFLFFFHSVHAVNDAVFANTSISLHPA